MCRAHGRRCPSSHPSGAALNARNAARRAKHAAKKLGERNAKIQSILEQLSTMDEESKDYDKLSEKLQKLDKDAQFREGDVERKRLEAEAAQLEKAREAAENLRKDSEVSETIKTDLNNDLTSSQINPEHKLASSENFPSPEELGLSTSLRESWEKQLFDGKKNTIDRKNKIQEILAALPVEQRDAIETYIGKEEYRRINGWLRGEPQYDLYLSESQLRRKLKTIVHNLDKTIAENSDNEDKIVYRGIAGEFANRAVSAPIGSQLSMPGFTSTSNSKMIASMFADSHRFTPNDVTEFSDLLSQHQSIPSGATVVFEMKTNKGMHLSGLEEETLLPRNTKWRVVGKRIVEMEAEGMSEGFVFFIQLADEDLLKS